MIIISLTILSPDSTLPSPPLTFTLSAINEAGTFDITAANANEPAMEDGISAFIFQVEATDGTYFILQVPLKARYSLAANLLSTVLCSLFQSSLSEHLDLSYFSCQEVNVSLAVVNRNGSSPFTSPSSVCVHGGTLCA